MSTPTTVVLAHLRAVGGAVAATPLLEHIGWAIAPSNEPKSEALTPLQRLRNLMGDLAYLDQVREVRKDCWQALDRWGKPIEKVPTVRIVAQGGDPSKTELERLGCIPERPEDRAKREVRESKAAAKERSSRHRPRGRGQLSAEDREERKEQVLRDLRTGDSIVTCAKKAGVTEASVRAWMDRDTKFREQVKAILAAEPRKTGKASSLTPEDAQRIRSKLAAGWGNTAIAALLNISVSRARGYIEQVKRTT